MLKFIGENCPVCKEVFKQGDDIVVCPTCGTPHHRECYKLENKCANESYHNENRFWESDNKPSAPEQKVCPKCKSLSPQNSNNCVVCGQKFTPTDNSDKTGQSFEMSEQNTNIDEIKINGLGIQNLHIYLKVNQKYFLSKFKQHENDKFFFSFNWPALLFSFVYYYYRKMYRIGSTILLLMAISLIPVFSLSFKLMPQILEYLPQIMVNPQIISSIQLNFTGLEGQLMLANICAKLPFIISLGGALVANYFYRQKVVKDITQITGEGLSTKESNMKLYLSGGVSIGNALFIIAFVVVMYFVIVNVISSGLI